MRWDKPSLSTVITTTLDSEEIHQILHYNSRIKNAPSTILDTKFVEKDNEEQFQENSSESNGLFKVLFRRVEQKPINFKHIVYSQYNIDHWVFFYSDVLSQTPDVQKLVAKRCNLVIPFDSLESKVEVENHLKNINESIINAINQIDDVVFHNQILNNASFDSVDYTYLKFGQVYGLTKSKNYSMKDLFVDSVGILDSASTEHNQSRTLLIKYIDAKDKLISTLSSKMGLYLENLVFDSYNEQVLPNLIKLDEYYKSFSK